MKMNFLLKPTWHLLIIRVEVKDQCSVKPKTGVQLIKFGDDDPDDDDADAQGRSLAMSRPTRKLRAMGNLGFSPPIWSPLFSRYTWSLFKRFDDDRHGHHDDFEDHHDFYLMVMMNIAKWRWRWYWWASGNENEHGIFPGTWDRLIFWRSRLSRR